MPTETVVGHGQTAEFGEHVRTAGDLGDALFPVGEDFPAPRRIGADAERCAEVVEDEHGVRGGVGKGGELAVLVVVMPGVAGKPQASERTRALAEPGVGVEAGGGASGDGQRLRMLGVGGGMADAAEESRAGCGVGGERFLHGAALSEVGVGDDAGDRRAGSIAAAGERGDELRFADRPQRRGAVGPIAGAALDENGLRDVVPRTRIGAQVGRQIRPLQAVFPPEVMVRIDDDAVGLHDLFADEVEPLRTAGRGHGSSRCTVNRGAWRKRLVKLEIIPMNSPDFVAFAADAAREAGAILMSHYEKVDVEHKGAFDTVTAADRAAEKAIVGRIRTRFPDHSIVAEEGGGVERGGSFVWYVDPLDGTTNFAHGMERFCVSIGLWAEGEGLVGVVFDPARGDLYCAEAGSGAYLNTRRLRVSDTADFRRALFATGFPSSIRRVNPNFHYFYQVAMGSHGVRRTGSAALDLCSVARGHLEGFWEIGLKPWDVGAGLVLVSEAGGQYCDFEGGGYRPGDARLVCANGKVTGALLELFAEIGRGELRAAMPPASGAQGIA